jgi:hypothetical protein
MKHFKQFIVDSGKWGAASEVAAFVFLCIGIWEHFRDHAVSSFSFLLAASTLFVLGSYAAWDKKRDELEKEKAKSEIAPDIEIQVLSLITKGKLSSGVTDLFAHIILTLRAPSEVVIKDFSITAQRGTEYINAVAIDDTTEWEVMKENPDGGYFHNRCSPIAKHLRQRGDPVAGWVHFPLENVRESWLLKSMLWVKANSLHGTCLMEAQGSHAFPDPKTKGVMRKTTEA